MASLHENGVPPNDVASNTGESGVVVAQTDPHCHRHLYHAKSFNLPENHVRFDANRSLAGKLPLHPVKLHHEDELVDRRKFVL